MSGHEPLAFSYGALPTPRAFIQWKGTDVCMDFHCLCGALCHFDGDFAYFVRCPHCDRVYQMPWNVFPRVVAEWGDHTPKDLEADETRAPLTEKQEAGNEARGHRRNRG